MSKARHINFWYEHRIGGPWFDHQLWVRDRYSGYIRWDCATCGAFRWEPR